MSYKWLVARSILSLLSTMAFTLFVSSNFDVIRGSLVMYLSLMMVLIGSLIFLDSARNALSEYYGNGDSKVAPRDRFEALMNDNVVVFGHRVLLPSDGVVILYEGDVEHVIHIKNVKHFTIVSGGKSKTLSPDAFIKRLKERG